MSLLLESARQLMAASTPAVLVTVADARGSSPRNTGAAMLVTNEDLIGTIGGGRLEYEATELARARLAGQPGESLSEMALGPALGQCCGGNVLLLLEPLDDATVGHLATLEGASEPAAIVTQLAEPVTRHKHTADDPIPLQSQIREALASGEPRTAKDRKGQRWLIQPIGDRRPLVLLFGAGHVGKAIATALAPLPCILRWIDQRPEMFPSLLPVDTEVLTPRSPVDLVAEAPPQASYLVMTHSHDLDFTICEAILRRGDFAYAGLIGSATKRRQCERRLVARGIHRDALDRLVCPIGIAGTTDKRPAVIAAMTVAQLLSVFSSQPPTP